VITFLKVLIFPFKLVFYIILAVIFFSIFTVSFFTDDEFDMLEY